MRPEENAPPPAEWASEPHPCPHCKHGWHGTACETCRCATSCLAPLLVIPANVTLGED